MCQFSCDITDYHQKFLMSVRTYSSQSFKRNIHAGKNPLCVLVVFIWNERLKQIKDVHFYKMSVSMWACSLIADV